MASILGIFSFRAVLNPAMLVTESELAKTIRSRMFNIVIDVIAKKSGGSTKFIDAMRNVMARLTPYISAIKDGEIRLYFCKSFRLTNPIAAKF